jgi:hypothetical protein
MTETMTPKIERPGAQRDFYFAATGLFFLMGSLALIALTGFLIYTLNERGAYEVIYVATKNTDTSPSIGYLFLSLLLFPLITFAASIFCAFIGTRLLRSAGVVTTEVIPARDFAILGPAVRDGNEQAITQWIRLNSLSGVTGTFTKIGLTGLPLATIVLTLLLALGGLVNTQLFELAKLTLGAFLGSFVQQRQTDAPRPTPDKPPATK